MSEVRILSRTFKTSFDKQYEKRKVLAVIFGNINSIEHCSKAAGSETCFVINLQGCTLRCMHCNVPEMFSCNINKKMSVDDIFSKVAQVENYIKSGGIVISGGEPLVQIDFVTEVFRTAKCKDLKTTLDTSGILFNTADTTKTDDLLKYTDMVLLNIKHMDNEIHKKLTGQANTSVLRFAEYLSAKKIPVKIGYVAIPNVNTAKKYLVQLGEFLAKLKNIKALDVTPFRNAANKYNSLNLNYNLQDIQTPSNEYTNEIRSIIVNAVKNYKTTP